MWTRDFLCYKSRDIIYGVIVQFNLSKDKLSTSLNLMSYNKVEKLV